MKSPINKQNVMQYGGIAAGYFAGNAIQNSAIGQKISNDKLRAGVAILLGAFLSKKGKGLMSNVGTGIAVSGTIKLLGSVLPENVKTMIAGGDDDYMGEIAEQIAGDTVLNGPYQYNDIAGMSVINGVDEFDDQPNA